MAKNATLTRHALPEGDERFLDDGVFPCLYGGLGEDAGPSRVEALELSADLEAAAGDDPGVVVRHAAQCHDLALWHQAIGTPYGYYLFSALGAESKLLQSCCLRIATHYPEFEFRLPVYPWFVESSGSWAEQVKAGGSETAPFQILVKSLRTWASLDQAVGVLSGASSLTLRAVRNPVVLLDRWLGGSQELAVALPQGASPEDPACPSEAGLPIGGNAVMRGAAKGASFVYLKRLEEAATEAGVELDLARHFKVSVFDLRTLGLFDESLVGRPPASAGRLLTFLAVSDLALFTPLHPMFAALRDGLRWNDLHPGFRLLRILEVVKDRGLELASTDAWAYWRFASAICQALHWPEVTRFLDAARSRDKDAPDDHVGKAFRRACAEREVNPAAFVDPFVALSQLDKLRPPAAALAGFQSDAETDDALSFAMDAELYALGFQVLFSTEPPRLSCPQFRQVVEQIHTAESLLEGYYGLQL